MSAGAKPGWAKGQRKEQRIAGCQPVTVLGQDVYGNPFSINTFTVEFSATGARLKGLPPVAQGSIVLVECGQERAPYRVVWVGGKDTSYEGHIGLECTNLNEGVFGIQPPAGTFYDEYKRVEAELHRSEGRYKSLFENSLGLICTHDLQGVLLSINPAAVRALGYTAHEGEHRSLADFLAPSVRQHFPEYLQRIRDHGHDSGYMLVVARNRTKRIWLYRNLLVCEQGNAPHVVGHAMDVTEQKTAEQQLQKTLKELQKALAEVKTLKGLLPICAWCKRIRTQAGDWAELESYVTAHSDASFSHGVCPDCVAKF